MLNLVLIIVLKKNEALSVEPNRHLRNHWDSGNLSVSWLLQTTNLHYDASSCANLALKSTMVLHLFPDTELAITNCSLLHFSSHTKFKAQNWSLSQQYLLVNKITLQNYLIFLLGSIYWACSHVKSLLIPNDHLMVHMMSLTFLVLN